MIVAVDVGFATLAGPVIAAVVAGGFGLWVSLKNGQSLRETHTKLDSLLDMMIRSDHPELRGKTLVEALEAIFDEQAQQRIDVSEIAIELAVYILNHSSEADARVIMGQIQALKNLREESERRIATRRRREAEGVEPQH